MSTKKQPVSDTRPPFITHTYTDDEIVELSKNQRKKYNKHMGLLHAASLTASIPMEQAEDIGSDENVEGSDGNGGALDEDGGPSDENGGASDENGGAMEVDSDLQIYS